MSFFRFKGFGLGSFRYDIFPSLLGREIWGFVEVRKVPWACRVECLLGWISAVVEVMTLYRFFILLIGEIMDE